MAIAASVILFPAILLAPILLIRFRKRLSRSWAAGRDAGGLQSRVREAAIARLEKVPVLADNRIRPCREAQLTSTRYRRSAWRCPAWRRAQPTGHPRSRFAENSWRACLPIARLSRIRL